MNIYFVNKLSRLAGPFDITDAYRNKIIRVGDVCIREEMNGTSFLLVTSEINKWSACKTMDFVEDFLGLNGNTLLFSFDGIRKRFGNIDAISKLSCIFKKTPVLDFFADALNILKYNIDLWDINVFIKIHELSPFQSLIEEGKTDYNISDSVTIFERYLSEEARELFDSMYAQGNNLGYIYREIRKQMPEKFREAMRLFLNENPQLSIYDTCKNKQ